MSWTRIFVGSIIATKKGFAFKSGEYVDSGVPIVRVSNFTSDSISDDDLKYYPMQEKSNYMDFALHTKDIIIQTVGSWQYNPDSVVGKVVHVPEFLEGALLNQNAVKIIPNQDIDRDFLFYRLRCDDFQGHVIGEARGAANQASITLDTIKSFAFDLPDYDTQTRIAGYLSAYDDLIENNRKQIKLLEEAARRLYKEWFVDLRFPGYEDTPVVDGVPEGWEKTPFSEKVEIMSGGTPNTSNPEYYRGNIPFYSPKDSDGSFFAFDTKNHISQSGLDNCNSKLYPPGTIIVTARGTVGKTTILSVPMAMNQSCYALKSEVVSSVYYLFFALRQEIAALKAMANGGVFDTIIVKTFDNISLLDPGERIIKLFDHEITPIIDSIRIKMHNNSLLAEARDRLLPKLMSGEMQV